MLGSYIGFSLYGYADLLRPVSYRCSDEPKNTADNPEPCPLLSSVFFFVREPKEQ